MELRRRPKTVRLGDGLTLDTLLDMVESKRNIIFFTGSGISATSGMSMFSTRNGLYERARKKFKVQDGIKLFTYSFYKQRREEVQAFFAQIYTEAQASRAAVGHHALASVHRLGAMRRQYTLNIDGLSEVVGLDTWHHERNPTGSTVEMHGNIRQLVCPTCHAVEPLSKAAISLMKNQEPVPCSACAGDQLRFKVMLYDDGQGDCITPEHVFDLLEEDLEVCDMVVWTGISFQQSASVEYFRRVRTTLNTMGRLESVPQVLINPSDEPYFNLMSALSNPAELRLLDVRETSDTAFPAMADRLKDAVQCELRNPPPPRQLQQQQQPKQEQGLQGQLLFKQEPPQQQYKQEGGSRGGAAWGVKGEEQHAEGRAGACGSGRAAAGRGSAAERWDMRDEEEEAAASPYEEDDDDDAYSDDEGRGRRGAGRGRGRGRGGGRGAGRGRGAAAWANGSANGVQQGSRPGSASREYSGAAASGSGGGMGAPRPGGRMLGECGEVEGGGAAKRMRLQPLEQLLLGAPDASQLLMQMEAKRALQQHALRQQQQQMQQEQHFRAREQHGSQQQQLQQERAAQQREREEDQEDERQERQHLQGLLLQPKAEPSGRRAPMGLGPGMALSTGSGGPLKLDPPLHDPFGQQGRLPRLVLHPSAVGSNGQLRTGVFNVSEGGALGAGAGEGGQGGSPVDLVGRVTALMGGCSGADRTGGSGAWGGGASGSPKRGRDGEAGPEGPSGRGGAGGLVGSLLGALLGSHLHGANGGGGGRAGSGSDAPGLLPGSFALSTGSGAPLGREGGMGAGVGGGCGRGLGDTPAGSPVGTLLLQALLEQRQRHASPLRDPAAAHGSPSRLPVSVAAALQLLQQGQAQRSAQDGGGGGTLRAAQELLHQLRDPAAGLGSGQGGSPARAGGAGPPAPLPEHGHDHGRLVQLLQSRGLLAQNGLGGDSGHGAASGVGGLPQGGRPF